MPAQWLTISEKHRRSPGLHASAADFTISPAEAAEPAVVLQNDRLSLYCLDDARREALFVELPASERLTNAGFVYMCQYEAAVRLLALPYEDFVRLAARLAAPERFVMVYMTGRCGSTLLSHAFNCIDGVVSLSEPDALIGLVDFRRAGTLTQDEMQELFGASVRLLYRKDGRLPPTCVLKMRNESIQLAEVIQTAFPDGRNLFVYRDAVGFVGSMYRIFRRLDLPEAYTPAELTADMAESYGLDAEGLFPHLGGTAGRISLPEYLTLWWLGVVEHYLAARASGIPMTAVRSEDVTGGSDATLRRVFRACGLGEVDPSAVRPAFRHDSQAGTVLDRERRGEAHLRLTPEQEAVVRAIVARHPLIGRYADELPGTLAPA